MANRSSAFEIACASIESVERARPGTVSAGDTGRARLGPGLIAFLETSISGTGVSLGAGYHARFTIPFGVAATAAYAVMAPLQTAEVSWTGYDVDIEWSAPAGLQDVLIAEAAVIAVDAGLASFAVSASTASGVRLFHGTLRLRALRDAKAIPTALLAARERPAMINTRVAGNNLLASVDAPGQLNLGSRAAVSIVLANDLGLPRAIRVSLILPPGAGLSLEGNPDSLEVEIPARSLHTVKWTLHADRPDEVNLRRPWPVTVLVKTGDAEERHEFRVSVPDPRPRRVFYILTEDCETFDGGPLTGDYGASSRLGNANNFMDPEDYEIQMIRKPNRMNEIAERHGARWTHFWCVPQRFAVDWACMQSSTGAWPALAAQLDESVRQGSNRHEYAPHIHFDYEWQSSLAPQPRLLYDAATDGILPHDYYDPIENPRHRYHDWDGSGRGIANVKKLGDLTQIDSKAGSLRKSVSYLARMQVNRRYPIAARTGGFDFGIDAADQAISTAAYEANGLRANSDARRTAEEPWRLRSSYWCAAEDRMREIDRLEAARLVQLPVAHETDFSDAAADNQWFAGAIQDTPASGVHLITAITHAMFMRGSPDPFRSLEGGSFTGLEDHLHWVRTHYPDVEFATASEAALEFMDYYTPRIEASVDAMLCGGHPANGVLEFGIRLLGAGIRLDEQHPATFVVFAPPTFAGGDLQSLQVVADGQVLVEANDFSSASRAAVTVTLTRRPADLRLRVFVKPSALAGVAELFQNARYKDAAEIPRAPLFRIRPPAAAQLSTDVLRLLMNPVSGSTEPLGRRTHPWGVFLLGAAINGALSLADMTFNEPVKLRLRWRKAIGPDADVYADCSETDPGRYGFRLRDDCADLLADGDIALGRSAVNPETRPADPNQVKELARELANLKGRYREAMQGVQDYDRKFQRVLMQYRRERAWKLMVLVRRLYVLLIRGNAAAAEHDLTFPAISDFVKKHPDS
jgi:hypothetical protein